MAAASKGKSESVVWFTRLPFCAQKRLCDIWQQLRKDDSVGKLREKIFFFFRDLKSSPTYVRGCLPVCQPTPCSCRCRSRGGTISRCSPLARAWGGSRRLEEMRKRFELSMAFVDRGTDGLRNSETLLHRTQTSLSLCTRKGEITRATKLKWDGLVPFLPSLTKKKMLPGAIFLFFRDFHRDMLYPILLSLCLYDSDHSLYNPDEDVLRRG